MGLALGAIGLLLVLWLVVNVIIVGVALAGAGVHARRAARLDATHSRVRVPVATVRLGAGNRRDVHGRRRSPRVRIR